MCGASLTLVGNVADFCRYTPTRRDMRIGLAVSAIAAAFVTTFVGGYAAAATGETNPFVAVADLVSSDALLVCLLAAIVVQGLAANITNVYTAGLSVVNTIPRLGRLWATIAAAAAAIALSAFPDFVNHAQRWITHLGNLGAPLTGVILADYLVVKRQRIDVPALFDPQGRYRYLNGINVAAILAIAGGVGVYYAVPQSWVKVVWGVGVSAALYLVIHALAAAVRAADRRSDRDQLLPALELALVDVALLGRPQLTAGEVPLVDRVVELARRDAVADAVQVLHLALELRSRAPRSPSGRRQHDRVHALDLLGARPCRG